MAIKRLYDTLVGASVAENQLINTMSVDGSKTESGITITDNRDGSYTVSGTATANVYRALTGKQVISGHKYFWSGTPKNGSSSTYRSYITGDAVIGSDDYGDGTVYAATTTGTAFVVAVYISNGATVNNLVFRPQLIDLTAYFGSASIADYLYTLETATVGAGVAKLREWGFFTGEYIPYNTGSLESVEARSHVLRGFNQWDEEHESGSYNAEGRPSADATRIRTKNPIRVIGGATYYMKSSTTLGIRFYDAEDNFIKSGYSTIILNNTITAPANAYWLRFSVVDQATYNHDICINLSSDRNGEYEPYASHTYDLGTDTLRGLFKLDSDNNLYADGDTKTSDGTVTRKRGRVVFDGSENWFIIDGNTNGTCFALNRSIPFVAWNPGGFETALSNIFNNATLNASTTGEQVNTYWWNNARTAYRVVWGTTTTTVEEFKAYLNEHNLIIEGELATPTTEQSTPFPSPQIVYPDGTEEFITENNVPVGHESKYQL